MRQKVGEAHALTARSEPVRSHTILVAVACVGRIGKELGRRARRLVHDIVEALEIDICFFAAVAFKLSTDGSRALREACVDAVRRHFHVVKEAISCVLRLAADEVAHLSSVYFTLPLILPLSATVNTLLRSNGSSLSLTKTSMSCSWLMYILDLGRQYLQYTKSSSTARPITPAIGPMTAPIVALACDPTSQYGG